MNARRRPARWSAASGAIALATALALASCGRAPTAKAATTAAPTATTYATPYIAPTATPAAPGQWTQVAGLVQAEVSMAPSNPTIAYQIGPSGVQRSGDSGATWSDVGAPHIPGLSSLIQPQLVSAFVSPANPNVLFMILSGYTKTSCGSGAGAHQDNAGGGGAPPGVTTWCENEFVSADRGVTWSRAQIPVPGLMTSMVTNYAFGPVKGEMQWQGSRLYALVVNELTGQEHGPPPGRLVVSGDGGVTWRLADQGLVAAGQGIWDYAATSSGTTIFAITEPLSTKPANMLPGPPVILTLWRSDNAGASWTRPGGLPKSGVGAMRAGLIGGVPTLYLQDFDSAGKGYIQASPWGASGHWQTAAAGPLAQNYDVLNTTADGSLLIASGAILAWRAGASGWRQVAANSGLTYPVSYTSLITTGGGQRLWLVGNGTSSGGTVVEYTMLTT